MKKVDIEELESLQSIKKIKTSTYNSAVKSAVEEGFSNSQKLQDLVGRMLSLDSKSLPNLEEFKIKEDKSQVSFEKTKNEANTVRKEIGIQVALEEAKINLSPNSVVASSPSISTPPTLLAWSSSQNNKISVIDLETKQRYVTFDGARINDTSNKWTHVKEIPNTKLLVSLYHNYQKSANMEIFDISNKGEAKKIYSLGEVSGSKLVVGIGDVAYNSRKSILGTIPVAGRIAYHLFNVDAKASNDGNFIKLNRKSKWHSQYSTGKDNFISGFDFNPAGESIATFDAHGVCLISAVNTDNYVFHLQFGRRDGVALGRSCILTAQTTRRATKAAHVSTRRIFCEYIARVAGNAIGDIILYTIWRNRLKTQICLFRPNTSQKSKMSC